MSKEIYNEKDDAKDEVLPSPSRQSSLSLSTPSLHTTPVAIDKHAESTSTHDGDVDSIEAADPDDLEEPYSVFTKGMKIWIVSLVSVSALISPFGATLFLPAMNVLREVLDISATQVNIAVTTYMLAQAFAPAFMGALSDSSGRRLAFIICFIIFIVANIGLALQTNYTALLLLRILQAIGCTAGIALTYAVVADVSTSAERGVYMGYAGAGLLVGPAFGPTIGGILAQFLGWRSTFWFLVIYSGVLLVLFVFLFPETCRNVVGNGSIPPTGLNRSVISCIQARKNRLKRPSDVESIRPPKRKFTLPNPLVTFRICLEKESGIILLYNGLFFTAMMTTVVVLPYLYGKTYNLSELHLGLCYIANGVGSMASSLTMGHIVDWNFRRHARLAGMPIIKGQQQDLSNFNIERVRLEIVLPSHIIGTAGLLIFGWTVHYGTHIAFPEIGLVIIGFGISGAFNITNNLLIDLHREVPAATTAAVNFVRCLLSAGGAAGYHSHGECDGAGVGVHVYGGCECGVVWGGAVDHEEWDGVAAGKGRTKEEGDGRETEGGGSVTC